MFGRGPVVRGITARCLAQLGLDLRWYDCKCLRIWHPMLGFCARGFRTFFGRNSVFVECTPRRIACFQTYYAKRTTSCNGKWCVCADFNKCIEICCCLLIWGRFCLECDFLAANIANYFITAPALNLPTTLHITNRPNVKWYTHVEIDVPWGGLSCRVQSWSARIVVVHIMVTALG